MRVRRDERPGPPPRIADRPRRGRLPAGAAAAGLLVAACLALTTASAAATAAASVSAATPAPQPPPVQTTVRFAVGQAQVVVNGRASPIAAPASAAPGGPPLVPLRDLAAALGYSVAWDAATQTATARGGGTGIEATVGARTVTVEAPPAASAGPAAPANAAVAVALAQPVPDVPPGRILVPATVAAAAFGARMAWDPVQGTVTFTAEAVPPPQPGTGPRVAGQVEVRLAFDASVFFAPGRAPLTAARAATPCYAQPGATFEYRYGLNPTGAPAGAYRPAGSPVSFDFPPTAGVDALCVDEGSSVTIPVPPGRYAAAYFLGSTAFGPASGTLTPVYSDGPGRRRQVTFADWCLPQAVAGLANGWWGADRVVSTAGMTAPWILPCGVLDTVALLDPDRTLDALRLSLGTPGQGGPGNETVTNILALSLGLPAGPGGAGLPAVPPLMTSPPVPAPGTGANQGTSGSGNSTNAPPATAASGAGSSRGTAPRATAASTSGAARTGSGGGRAAARGARAAAAPLPSVHVRLPFNASVFLRPGTRAPAAVHASTPCLPQAYATFESFRALNASGAPTGTYRPAGSPVTFAFPATAGRDALCVPAGGTVKIPVPPGRYAAAEFLAGTAFGPAGGVVVADYAGGAQGDDAVTFPDWCIPGAGAIGWVGQARVEADSGAVGTFRCGVFVVRAALDAHRTLRSLAVTLPGAAAGGTGLTVTNIVALSLERAPGAPFVPGWAWAGAAGALLAAAGAGAGALWERRRGAGRDVR